jgi:hypothetical protein
LGCFWLCRVLQRWRAYGARVVGRNGLRMTEMARESPRSSTGGAISL